MFGTEKIIRFLLQPLRIYAVCGFILGVTLHILAIAGLQPNNKVLLVGPGIAIFPLWLPVTHLSMRLTRGLSRKEAWKAMFSGCPEWMKSAVNILYWYALVNFAVAIIIVFLFPAAAKSSPGSAPRFFWILASSYYMLFYFAGLAALTAVSERGMPTCPNGHSVSINDKYCPICGARIQRA
jgi:hypothetical protein